MANIDEYGYVTIDDTERPTNEPKSTSIKNNKIKRDAWPLWVTLILVGVVSGFAIAYFFAVSLINDIFDIDIPVMIGGVIIGIIGAASGAVISHFAQEKYQTADAAWPWLLLAFCIPVATFLATAIICAAIGIVVGIAYIIMVILVLAIGGAIAAACCGGG